MITSKTIRRRGLESLQALLGRTPLPGWYARSRSLDGAVILMYHSVAGDNCAPYVDPSNRIAPDRFERHARFLATRRTVIRLDDLVEMVTQRRPVPPGTVVLTFDDGYLDNLEVAFPILDRYQLPATLFVPTSYVDDQENQWIDRLYCAFKYRTRPITRSCTIQACDSASPAIGEANAYSTMQERLLAADYAQRRKILSDLESELHPQYDRQRLTLNWSELKLIRESFPLVEIGSHSMTHGDLSAMCEAKIRDELRGSKSALQANLDREITQFAFPYNRTSPIATRILHESGYKAAVAAGDWPRVGRNSQLCSLARLEAPDSLSLLAFCSSGAYPELSLRLFDRA